MHWRFLDHITEWATGSHARAEAVTRFPPELFADHFPGRPITPGVLLIEICAQLAGRLIEVTASGSRGLQVFPVLTMVLEAKLRRPVGPDQTLDVHASLSELREESAICACELFHGESRVASMRLLFAFHPDGQLDGADPAPIIAFERAEFHRLGLEGFPPGEVRLQNTRQKPAAASPS